MLAGKTVLVTGAAHGLGAAIAEACVVNGGKVVITDILDDELAATSTALGVDAHRLDVTDADAWTSLAATLESTVGSLDALVNNAGVIYASPLVDASEEELRRTLDVNVVGIVPRHANLRRTPPEGRRRSIGVDRQRLLGPRPDRRCPVGHVWRQQVRCPGAHQVRRRWSSGRSGSASIRCARDRSPAT